MSYELHGIKIDRFVRAYLEYMLATSTLYYCECDCLVYTQYANNEDLKYQRLDTCDNCGSPIYDADKDCPEFLDGKYEIEDIAKETVEQAIKDCDKFRELAGDILCDENYLGSSQWDYEDVAGGDFWLTRNGHGSGFWDSGRWEKKAGEKLTKISNNFREIFVDLMDDQQTIIAE